MTSIEKPFENASTNCMRPSDIWCSQTLLLEVFLTAIIFPKRFLPVKASVFRMSAGIMRSYWEGKHAQRCGSNVAKEQSCTSHVKFMSQMVLSSEHKQHQGTPLKMHCFLVWVVSQDIMTLNFFVLKVHFHGKLTGTSCIIMIACRQQSYSRISYCLLNVDIL